MVIREPQQTATPRILIVEDDPEMLEFMRVMLDQANCQIQVAHSGEQALEILQQEQAAGNEIDMVLLDIMMPRMDGYEVIARVKADPDLQNTSFIVTTALDSVSDKTLGLGIGADDYLTKPFDPRELLARIDAVMRIRRSEQALRRRNEELAALVEINRVVTSSLELDEVLEATMRGIRKIMQVETGVLVLLDEETGVLTFRKTLSPEHGWVTGQTVPPGEGVVGHVVASGEPMLINDVEREPYFSDEIDQELGGVSPETILCVPLMIHNRVIGAIELVNKLDGQFNEQDLDLLNAMAASVAVAVDNANLYAELNDFAEELERSQAQLVQAEKMAAIGRLAASLAHEINNPLQAIHNTLHLSSQAALGSEKRLQYLDMAQDEVQNLIEIVQRMLDFYRPSRGDARPTDVNEVVERVLALARKRLRHNDVEVHTALSDDLPTLSLVADQISQVFLNLVINAIEAMPDGGDLWVETSLSGDESEILVTFRDSGVGMSAEEIASLFEPFYTTKVDGTGLGLAISYGIIERHRGVIEVSSQPGAGSTFVVRLPV